MSNRQNLVAEVMVDVPAAAVDRPFDYLIPSEMAHEVRVGSRVQVPFGARMLVGYVIELKEKSAVVRMKSIRDVMDLSPPLTLELVQLGKYMAEEYLCSTITALQAMVPAVLKGTYRRVVHLHPAVMNGSHSLSRVAADELISHLRLQRECTWEEALQFPQMNRVMLKRLVEEELILVEERVADRTTQRKVTWIWPNHPQSLSAVIEQLSPRALRQREMVHFFIQHPAEVKLSELLAQLKTTRSTAQKLVETGILSWEEREQYRDPYADRTFHATEPLRLTPEQQQAYAAILAPIQARRFHSLLLQGVTGSGKTEIYLQAIDQVLKAEREAIVLVPEISLTPQMVNRFKGRFGAQVAVLHSGLSSGERYDEWRKIRLGRVKIAIGARSAIFAPFERLGLIIIDEEHESSYRQEENPKYHAREIALWRSRHHQATLVLGTATPAIETYYQARTGGHEWVTLTERVHQRPFPQVEVVDMRKELRAGNRTMFSSALKNALVECIKREEQVVLFLNRRGFSTFVLCRDCGETLMCPHCDISLTYHQTNRTVRCHYCGYAEGVPTHCPSCQSSYIRHFGMGTQRVEEELVQRFPGIRVIRMDVDTTSRKGAHEKYLTAFEQGKADVLLGTQMIAKGLDFPKVTLVGVIAADAMLHLPDFRAAERTFQLLTQVSGRAGRHEQPGRVVIQTYNSDHYSIEMAAKHQGEAFYRQECLLRKQHLYPPFCGLFTLLFSHPDRVRLIQAGQEAAQYIGNHLGEDAQLLGPVPAAVPRLKDRYRLQMLIKFKEVQPVYRSLQSCLRGLNSLFDEKELRISIDCEGVARSNGGNEVM
jgi:primosomal protein N' (replication factor Y) (superfamily II helicase)